MMVEQGIFYLLLESFGKSNGLGVCCVNGVNSRKIKVLWKGDLAKRVFLGSHVQMIE